MNTAETDTDVKDENNPCKSAVKYLEFEDAPSVKKVSMKNLTENQVSAEKPPHVQGQASLAKLNGQTVSGLTEA